MVFIAAGKGSRLSFVTNGMPKTLIKVFDRPLIDILLENCSSVGIQDIVIVTGYGQDYITDLCHFLLVQPQWDCPQIICSDLHLLYLLQ